MFIFGPFAAAFDLNRPASFKQAPGEFLDDDRWKLRFNQVMRFVDEDIGFDKPDLCKHILIVYEEIEDARKIEMRYLKNQLASGQACVCLIRSEDIELDESMLRNEIKDNGIDAAALESSGHLMIIPISGSDVHCYNTKNAVEIMHTYTELLRNCKRVPTAGFGILPSEQDLIKPERLALQLELEQMANKIIAQSDSTWICPYHVSDIFESLDKPWMQELVRNHDAVMYVPKNSNGLALKLV